MGIENRDYIRERERHEGMGGSLSAAPVVTRILIATIAVYLLQLFFFGGDRSNRFESPATSVVQQWLALDVDKVLDGQVWRLVSCALVHDPFDIWHIAINMLVLVWFGRSLEQHYGSREFFLFYLVAIIIASLSHIGLQLALGERVPAIGASGGVLAVFCLFAMWNPGYTVSFYFFLPVPIIWLLGIYVLYDLHPVLLELAGVPDGSGVAHAAHLGGIAFAFLYFRENWSVANWIKPLGFGRPASGRKTQASNQNLNQTLTPHQQEQQDREERRVDEILAKISVEGESSLTKVEREILLTAANRYKNKRGSDLN